MKNIVELFPRRRAARPHLVTPAIKGETVPDRGTPEEDLTRACYRMQVERGLGETHAALRKLMIDTETALLIERS